MCIEIQMGQENKSTNRHRVDMDIHKLQYLPFNIDDMFYVLLLVYVSRCLGVLMLTDIGVIHGTNKKWTKIVN